MRRLEHMLAWTFAALAGGCAAQLPPAAMPAEDMPAVPMPTTPAPQGHGYVVIDTPEEPSSAAYVTGHGYGVTSRGRSVVVQNEEDVCHVTPCVADLKTGPQTLVLRSNDGLDVGEFEIDVGDRPLVVRHMYEQRRGSTGVYVSGLVVGITGVSLALSGLLTYAISNSVRIAPPGDVSSPDRTAQDLGIGFAVTGAAMLIAGGLMMYLARGTHRAGATLAFRAPASPANTSPSEPSAP